MFKITGKVDYLANSTFATRQFVVKKKHVAACSLRSQNVEVTSEFLHSLRTKDFGQIDSLVHI